MKDKLLLGVVAALIAVTAFSLHSLFFEEEWYGDSQGIILLIAVAIISIVVIWRTKKGI